MDSYYDSEEDNKFGDYSSNDDKYYDNSDTDDANYYAGDIDDEILVTKKPPYTVWQEADIRNRQEELASEVSSTLSVSKVEASKLLYHYKWDESTLYEEWFVDEEMVRAKYGLLNSNSDDSQFRDTEVQTTCGICFDTFPLNEKQLYPMPCGHAYCIDCWKGYIRCSINDGPRCLSLRCPEPKCNAAVCRDMIDKLVSEEEKEKFCRYYVRAYVEESKKIKWCPAPDCENAVELELCSEEYDVTCLCTNAFCWNCVEETHRPVDCETVRKWTLKNSSDGENVTWIIANSKPCPKCKRSIEKDKGCMHMTCTPPCNYSFCWLCLGPWTDHSAETDGYYTCNIHEAEKQKESYDEEEAKRELAKKRVEKYVHYYERWKANDQSKDMAIKDLHRLQRGKLDKLADRAQKACTELEFVENAWKQIVECRRVLKWTYAYGYYLPDEEDAKKTLFEFLQGQAEAALELLHQCAESELSDLFKINVDRFSEEEDKESESNDFFKTKVTLQDNSIKEEDREKLQAEFGTFREKLIDLTKITCSYFHNLVRALENGLSDVDS